MERYRSEYQILISKLEMYKNTLYTCSNESNSINEEEILNDKCMMLNGLCTSIENHIKHIIGF